MAMTMARTMAKQQRAKFSMLKWCYHLSTHSHGTHVPVPVPEWRRWEGISKPSGGKILEDGRPAFSPLPAPAYDSDGSDYDYDSDDGRRLAYYPPPAPAASDSEEEYDSDNLPSYLQIPPPTISASLKYVGMGLLRPWSLKIEMCYKSKGLFSPEFYQTIDRFKAAAAASSSSCAHSNDGTPAPRWWELMFKKPWRLPPGISDDDRPAPQLSDIRSISNWEGRLKRWKLGHTFRPYPDYSVEDCVAQRVSEIAECFKVPELPDDFEIDEVNPERFEYWLDDVQGYYEFMDLAHELHSIDCLFPLLHHVLVRPRAPCIRAKTAELVTSMVHNNPRSQQLVLELHGLQPLWYNFTSDPNVTSRTKALGAISALIRNNKSGITAFRDTNGYAALWDALSSENDVRLQREALNLIQYLLHENSSDCITVTELGLPHIMMHLASSDDAEVRVAALRGLLVLARNEGTYGKKIDKGVSSGQLVKNNDKLKHVLQKLIKRISAMTSEDLSVAREEIQFVGSLWNTCYNEPSSLKLFELSPRAWAAAEKRNLHFF